jgi:hypothetical protein
MIEHRVDRCHERTEGQTIPWPERRWRRTVFRSDMKVACAEDNGCKPSHGIRHQRVATCQPYLDFSAASLMGPAKARGQRRRIVRDDEVTATKDVSDV